MSLSEVIGISRSWMRISCLDNQAKVTGLNLIFKIIKKDMKRYVLTFPLVVLCMVGSTYMVLESAGYFKRLYTLVGLPEFMGWYTAILSEAFQIILVMALPNDEKKAGFKYFLLLIVILIYILNVFAAGMNVGKPMIASWSKSDRNEKLLNVLEQEQQSLTKDLELFQNQNQQLNTAKTIKAKRQSFQEIKSHLSNEQPLNLMLVQVELSALWLLRVLIQLANLCCARIVGILWTNSNKSKSKAGNTIRDRENTPEIIRKWKAKYTRKENGFIGIAELSNGQFLAKSPKQKKAYKTFQGALKSFEGTPYQNKIVKQASRGRKGL
jgi:hypothetical protein